MTSVMTTVFEAPQTSRTGRSAAIAAAALALAAMSFAGAAQARGDVSFSVGVAVPDISVGVVNAYPFYGQQVYEQPVYVRPAPVYLQSRPVYVQPAPVYYSGPPVYYAPQPGYYKHPRGRGFGHNGYRGQQPIIYGPGYGPRGPRTIVNGQIYVGR